MKNYKKYYNDKFNFYVNDLIDRYQNEVTDRKGNKGFLRREFIAIARFEKDNIIHETEHKEPIRGDIATNYYKNDFKEDLIESFMSIPINFPEDGIDGFVKFDIPRLKQLHIDTYEKGFTDNYKADTKFMFKASINEMLDMIAKWCGYHHFFEKKLPPLVQDVTSEMDSHEDQLDDLEKDNYSTAQQVIAILLLQEIYGFKKHQDDKRLVDFIEFLTGKSHRNIWNFVTRFKDHGRLHGSKNQNLKDYYVVRKKFEEVENQQVLKLIDKIIDRIKQLSDKN